jgi:hypothetical protein
VIGKKSSFLDTAIGVLERAAPKSQRVQALNFLRGKLQGQAPQAGDAADRPTKGAPDHHTMPRPTKR